MMDLIVENARSVLDSGVRHVDICVASGTIAALTEPGKSSELSAAKRIDAKGRLVIPGGIDPHVHCSLPIFVPNKVDLERSAPPETVTRAALYGGTTTLIDFAFGSPQLSLQES